MSDQSFVGLGVSKAVNAALERRGITRPFPVQRSVLPDALAGHDVLVKSPTGSGKSLAFGLPVVDRLEPGDRPGALVLAPTRELAVQIVDELRAVADARGLAIAAVYGGTSIERQRREAAAANVLVATPGRLEDLLARRAFTLAHVRILVLDEADRMLDMGFKPAVDRIVAQTPRERQTMLFSATLEPAVERLARAYTVRPRRHQLLATGRTRGDVEHRFVAVDAATKLGALVGELRRPERGRTLVFVRTKRGADRLVKRLRAHNVDAIAIHGDKSQRQREKALASFTAGRTETLVATDVAARGLDVAGITHVINFDAPGAREDYVHRVGRTGRAGQNGVGVTLVAAEQARDIGRIARDLALAAEFSRSGLAA
jgi:ATP-dependent RNA helicase RhlE